MQFSALAVITALFSCAFTYAQSSILFPIDLSHSETPAVASPVAPVRSAYVPFDPDHDLMVDPIYACACGCGVFDVGTSTMFPMGTMKSVWVEYDFLDQTTNWNGHTSVPAAYNPDKKLQSSWYIPGFQYMFDRNWGVMAELPITSRYFETTGGATGHELVHSTWTDIGDLRIEGIYDGIFEDQSLGIELGLKFPTGNYKHNNAYGDVDRDVEIGSGSTDLLLGGYFRHSLIRSARIDWYSQALLDLPFIYSTGATAMAEKCAVFRR